MHNNYKKTIKKMIIANESLKAFITDGICIDEDDNKLINIELFFLAFSIFEDCFKRMDINDSWKELFKKQDYYVDEDKIIFGETEVSFELLEMTFIDTMLKFREKCPKRIFDISNYKSKFDKQEVTGSNDFQNVKNTQVIRFIPANVKTTDEQYREEAVKYLNSYEVDKTGYVDYYLGRIRREFKELAYDGIISLYNNLKKGRSEKIFKSNLPLIKEERKDNKWMREFAYFLLSIYPIQFYAKDKECIDYSSLLLSNALVNANHYRYDNTMDEFEKRFKEIDRALEDCMIFLRNRKVRETEKRRVRFRISQLEWQRRRIEEEYMIEMIDQADMMEVFDEETEEYYHTGKRLNKHILYNLELAIRNGHVDIIKKSGGHYLVLYGIVDKDVDFIIDVESGKLMDVFDIDNLLSSLINDGYEKRMLDD